MSENILINKALTPKNILSMTFTLNNNTKQQNTAFTNMVNATNKTFSTYLNLNENGGTNDSRQEPKNKKSFIIKKINLKESSNNYYSTALQNIFHSPVHFLNDSYQGKKVLIGKNKHLFHDIITNKDLSELIYPRIKKRKKTISSSNNSLIIMKRGGQRKKSLKSSRKDIDKFNSSESSRSYRPLGEQRTFSVSDNELKVMYKDVEENIKNNKNNIQDIILNQTGAISIGHMLDLQERILKKNKHKPQIRRKLIDKIMNKTFKEKKNILMNEMNDFLILKRKKLDKELTKFCLFHNTSNIANRNWMYNLRKNILNKNEERKCISPLQKEIIYYNKDFFPNELNFDMKKKLFNKIPKIKLNNDDPKKNRILSDTNLNSFRSLYIQGKNLLSHEIKLSKDLVGKKKKLIQYTFIPKEISSMLLAKSKSKDSVMTPRAIVNTMNIHDVK